MSIWASNQLDLLKVLTSGVEVQLTEDELFEDILQGCCEYAKYVSNNTTSRFETNFSYLLGELAIIIANNNLDINIKTISSRFWDLYNPIFLSSKHINGTNLVIDLDSSAFWVSESYTNNIFAFMDFVETVTIYMSSSKAKIPTDKLASLPNLKKLIIKSDYHAVNLTNTDFSKLNLTALKIRAKFLNFGKCILPKTLTDFVITANLQSLVFNCDLPNLKYVAINYNTRCWSSVRFNSIKNLPKSVKSLHIPSISWVNTNSIKNSNPNVQIFEDLRRDINI